MVSAIGLVLVANFVWLLVRPLLPVAIVVGVVLTAVAAWRHN